MNLTPLETGRGAAVNAAAAKLRDRILDGTLAPGQRLIVRELLDETGLGASTLREALQRLASDGLIKLSPNRGAEVQRFSRRDVRDLFQVREALEAMAARLAALAIANGGPATTLAALVAGMRRDGVSDSAAFIRENNLFHDEIVAISGNRRLAGVLERMQPSIIILQTRSAMTRSNVEESFLEHLRIGDAILAGDAEAAERHMSEHMRRACAWCLSLDSHLFRKEPDE